MIASSFVIGPKTEALRQRIMSPFSLVVSPGQTADLLVSKLNCDEYPRCAHCGAYYSSISHRDASSWSCALCSKSTPTVIADDVVAAADVQILVDEPIGLEVTVLYLSLDFHSEDIEIIKPPLLAFLNEFDSRPLVVMLGHSDAPFALLCPDATYYSIVDGIVTSAPPQKLAASAFPAPIQLLSDVSSVNFCSFIFAPAQFASVLATIRKLRPISGKLPFDRVLTVSSTLCQHWPNNPIHFIAIVPQIGVFSKKLDGLHSSLVRLDVLTPTFNSFATEARNIFPGLVLIFMAHTLLKSLKTLIADRSIYQNFMKSRSRGVVTTWKPLPAPCCFDDQGHHFAPVLPNNGQSFVLDMRPNGHSATAVVQITSKMVIWSDAAQKHVTVVRAFSRSFQLSEDPREVVGSVDPSVIIWLWLTRTLNESVRHVIAGLFRATAGILKYLPRDDVKAKQFIHSCCSLKFFDLTSDVPLTQSNSRYSLCLTAPTVFKAWPDHDPDKKFAICLNCVYADDKQNQAAIAAYNEIAIGARIVSPVPEWCVSPDPASFQFLESLLSG
jgi:hypothetical protein